MNKRGQDIGTSLKKFLDRYIPPTHLKENDEARLAEGYALLKVLTDLSPQDDYTPWVELVLERCSLKIKTRAWPTVFELHDACQSCMKGKSKLPLSSASNPLNEDAINAQRIRKHEALGEYWVFGRGAARLILNGEITEDQRQGYVLGWLEHLRTPTNDRYIQERKADLEQRFQQALADEMAERQRKATPTYLKQA